MNTQKTWKTPEYGIEISDEELQRRAGEIHKFSLEIARNQGYATLIIALRLTRIPMDKIVLTLVDKEYENGRRKLSEKQLTDLLNEYGLFTTKKNHLKY